MYFKIFVIRLFLDINSLKAVNPVFWALSFYWIDWPRRSRATWQALALQGRGQALACYCQSLN